MLKSLDHSPGPPSPENPPERPFSLGEVLAYAATVPRQDGSPWKEDTACVLNNLRSGLSPCVSLTSTGAANVILAPSIAYAKVDEATSKLTLQGEFDTTAAPTVVIGQTPTDTTPFTVGGNNGQTEVDAPVPPQGPVPPATLL